MERNKKMDKLSQDACDALKAGMSYGKYMAMKGYSVTARPTREPVGYRHVCQFCGKEFYVQDKSPRKFCNYYCRQNSYYVPKIRNYEKACEVCGKEFVTTKKQQKYCSEHCAKFAKSQQQMEARLMKKEARANG